MRTVRDVMAVDVATIEETDVIGTARDKLLDGRIHAVPVRGATGRVVGVLSSFDLVEEWAPEQGVTTVMSTRVRYVDPGTTVAAAAAAMIDARVHHLVVLEGVELAGIVSSFDLLRELATRVPEQLPRSGDTHDALQTVEAVVPGDLVVVHAKAVGTRERRGVVVRTAPDGRPPYYVNWLEDPHDPPHEVMFFPGSDSHIEHRTHTTQPA